MKTLSVVAVVLAMVAVTASAAILPGGQMKLAYYPDGTATLETTQLSAFDIDTYEIWSATNKLDPTDGTGWRSLGDWAATDPITLMNALGAGALSFGELAATTGLLAEGSLTGFARFQPASPFSIGKPIQNTVPPVSDLSFYYTKPSVAGDKFIGVVELIPEPATVALLAGGALTLVRRRRTKARRSRKHRTQAQAGPSQ